MTILLDRLKQATAGRCDRAREKTVIWLMTLSHPNHTEIVPPRESCPPIKVYLVASASRLAESMAELLRRQPGIRIVGTALTFEEALTDLRATEVDVLVLDVCTEEGESLEAIQDIKQLRPRIKILVTTAGGWENQQIPSILAGANGFLYEPFDLAKAISLVHEGKVFFDAVALVEALSLPPLVPPARPHPLSNEDYDFLDLIRQGMSNDEIAKKWKTEIKAIYQRRFRLKSKLGLRSARDLINFSRSARDLKNFSGVSPFKRILVVDDEPMVLQSIKFVLKSAGHTVETAADAEEALKKTEEATFDLIVADLRLPGMQGDELARKIKSRKSSPRVILLTAFPPDSCPPDFDVMLLKPFSVGELRKVVAT